MNDAIATEIVRTFSLVVSTSANSYSFQAVRKPMIAVAPSAGRASGRMMSQNARYGDAPSTIAASSSSRGICSKYSFMIQRQSG
jgi:hypothetical protein